MPTYQIIVLYKPDDNMAINNLICLHLVRSKQATDFKAQISKFKIF